MWWARLHLGRLWSASVTRKADHHVIDTGPYAVVRHPIYTGLLFAIAATVSVRATAETLAGAAMRAVAARQVLFDEPPEAWETVQRLRATGIYIKARTEEAFLRDQLGAETYEAYARRVPMLVPFIRAQRRR